MVAYNICRYLDKTLLFLIMVISLASMGFAQNVNLTFDDSLTSDVGVSSLVWDVQGSATWVTDKEFCLYNKCANFTVNNGDYINSTLGFALNDGISVSYWVYTEQNNAGTDYYWGLDADGNSANFKGDSENDYGMTAFYRAENGEVSQAIGASYVSVPGSWEHYCTIYSENKGRLYMYKDGQLIQNTSENYGNLNYTIGEEFTIGDGRYGDMEGYIDEFLMWNSSINPSICVDIYNKQIQGAPPDIDIYIKDIVSSEFYNFTNSENNISLNTQVFNITFANGGITDSVSFPYQMNNKNVELCSGTLNITAGNQQTVSCNWNPSIGWQEFKINFTISDNITENNQYTFDLTYKSHPRNHFNQTQWNTILQPFCDDNNNGIGYNSCNFYKSFLSDDFNDGWLANTVDYRGKKARENAMNCMYNNWNRNLTACQRALKHLQGWANRTVTDYTDVQGIPSMVEVLHTYDLMFPIFTQEEYRNFSLAYHNICQRFTNLDNTRPDLDDDDALDKTGNGAGFGDGMHGTCEFIKGEYKNNVGMIQNLTTSYYGSNINQEWRDRQENYLRGNKNDSYTKFQERWLYQFYSTARQLETLIYYKVNNPDYLENYTNYFCSMGRHVMTDILDDTYNGNVLRGDENRYWRGIQAGDSNSYEDIGSDTLWFNAIIDGYAYLCGDSDLTNSLYNLRIEMDNDRSYTIPEMYMFYYAFGSAENISAQITAPRFMYDNANDIVTIRKSYTYYNDTVIQIDGGEERGGGHSQAQGYYLYVLGEPFLDYEQVPLEDDVRMSTWKNGISLGNTSVTSAGSNGQYLSICGGYDEGYQYVGMSNCTIASFAEDYPDYRAFPLEYGGDIEDYMSSDDASTVGAYVWRPYYNANKVKEYYILYNNVLLKRIKVSGNNNNEGIYHNFINSRYEFDTIEDNNNISFNRSNKYLNIGVVWSNETFILDVMNTTINASSTKTGTANLEMQYRRSYLYTPSKNADLIISHNWYQGNSHDTITTISPPSDKGLSRNGAILLFDIEDDGEITYGTNSTDGWGLIIDKNSGILATFNATDLNYNGVDLITSNTSIEMHINISTNKSIIFSPNTMKRSIGIDYPDIVRVTINTQSMENNSEYTILKDNTSSVSIVSSTNTSVTFDVYGGQIPTFYTITAIGIDSVQEEETSDSIIPASFCGGFNSAFIIFATFFSIIILLFIYIFFTESLNNQNKSLENFNGAVFAIGSFVIIIIAIITIFNGFC